MSRSINIAVLPGDGVGPEVTAVTSRIIGAALADVDLTISEYPFGGAAIDRVGSPFPEQTREGVINADAVLLGAVGGPQWDSVEGSARPEAGLLALRKLLDVFANLRPVVVERSDGATSPLKAEVANGVDLLIVRELTGGIYFGEPRWTRLDVEDPTALDSMVYSRSEIVRVARVAFERARLRRGRVTSVDKANVLATSRLWRDTVVELHRAEFADVELNHLYVDNAAMQLVTRPSQFDVVLCGNLFGDILSDLAAVLPGSIGLLPSASIGTKHGLFEPVHGSAPDIAGTGTANPVGCILSGALLLEYLGEIEAATSVRLAVSSVRREGYGTRDLASNPAREVSTEEFGERVCANLRRVSVPS